jgi:acyl-coenzyme A synthetase/AMP-(fatty) acid ligase
VEPAEIEAALLNEPEVRAAVVLASGEPTRLTAYVVVTEPSAADLAGALRDRLRLRLPWELVPSAIELVPDLARAPSGKLDLRAMANRD